jgi:sugar transferase EpsL
VEQTVGACRLSSGIVHRPSVRGILGRTAKRLFDVAFASAALILLSPVMGAVALAIRLSMGSPVAFRQYRVGLGGKPFILLKYRTMRQGSHRPGLASADGERTTRLGRLLRKTKLDELPELLNVLRGEMSIVGPRPLMPETEDYYVMPYARQAWLRRHDVRPGLTGWGQVCGNTSLAFSQRFALDVWYIDHRSFLFDLRVIADTLLVVVRGERECTSAVEAAERYVYSDRERARIRMEPRSHDLPAPVGRPVTGPSAAPAPRVSSEAQLEVAALPVLRTSVAPQTKKVWARPSVVRRPAAASTSVRMARLGSARRPRLQVSGSLPSGVVRLRHAQAVEREPHAAAAGMD